MSNERIRGNLVCHGGDEWLARAADSLEHAGLARASDCGRMAETGRLRSQGIQVRAL